VMTLVQCTTLFTYYLLAYLVTHFDQIYSTAFYGAVFESIATFISGMIMYKLGARKALLLFYSCAALGGILLLTYGLDHLDSLWFPVFYLLCRFGIAGPNVIMIAANAKIFHVEIAATAFGTGSFFGRLIASAVPLVSTLP